VQALTRLVARGDEVQRRTPAPGFAVAVFKKFGEDRAGQLAALIAYYGFFSLFPLLLALVTLSGLLLSEQDSQERLVDAALNQFPVIGDRLRENLQSLPDKSLGFGVGLAGALWAGLGGMKAAQNAMDHVWNVPIRRQPSFPVALARAFLMLVTIGIFIVLAAFLGGVAAGTEQSPPAIRIAGVAGSAILNFLVFWVAFRVLTVADVSWRDAFPGAVFAGGAWTLLQTLGGYVIGHRMESATATYGFFAVVIGLLTWMYLGAQVTLLAAEVNVVRARRFWPRALSSDELTDVDRAVLRDHARVEERREEERVSVDFENEPSTGETARPRGGTEPTSAVTQGSPNGQGMPTLIRSIVSDVSHLVGKQIELAKLELAEMLGTRARAAGVFAAAGLLGLFVVGFLGLAGAAALDLVVPRWASLLIVAGVFAGLAVVAAVLGRRWLRSAAAKPELTQHQLKEDVAWAKAQLKR
jgi:YihY family inner membrane protein